MPAQLKARLSYAGLLKKVFDAMRELCSEREKRRSTNVCLMHCSDGGITFQQQDYNHVAMLDSDGFDRYSCSQPFTVSFNTTSMRSMLVLCKRKDSVKLSYDGLNPDHLSLTFTSKHTQAFVQLCLVDVDTELLAVPRVQYACTASMDSGEVRKALMQHNNNRPKDGCVGMSVKKGELQFDWGETADTRKDKEGREHDVPSMMGVTRYRHEKRHRAKGRASYGSGARSGDKSDAESDSSSEEEEWDSEWDSDEEEEHRTTKEKAAARKEKAERKSEHRLRVLAQQADPAAAPLQCSYSLRYLAALTKHPMSTRVFFHMTHAMPLCIEYALRHDKAAVGSFRSYVAPRMCD